MNAETVAPGADLSQARTQGTSPIRGIVEHFQWTLVETARP